ncbi:MAG TPA: YraN family protein [candidate division Zixibacteria bacterium]|nr:YraN family protein [candidate division Zixibacteria bacterium]
MSCSDYRESSTNKPLKSWQKYEKLASEYLKQHGFDILAANWRSGRYEIDLIARKGKQVVFVEVKSVRDVSFGHPAERVDVKKTINLTRAAQAYVIEKSLSDCDLRFDVITFIDGRLEHYPNAFEAADEAD